MVREQTPAQSVVPIYIRHIPTQGHDNARPADSAGFRILRLRDINGAVDETLPSCNATHVGHDLWEEGTVEGTARRVAVFLGAGVLLAALVGVTVWATSAPGQNNRAGFTAEAAGTAEPSPASALPGETTPSGSDDQGSDDDSRTNRQHDGEPADTGEAGRTAAPAPSGYNAASDPYLPPHAVVTRSPQSGQTSRVYRPSNIVPSPARPTAVQGDTRPTAEPAPANGRPSAQTTSPQTPSGGALPSATKPATPAPESSTTQPSEAEEPVLPSAPDPGAEPAPDATQEAHLDGANSPAAPQAPSALPAEQPTTSAPARVAGKEDVAGYPREKQASTARDVINGFTGAVTQ